MFFYLVWQFVIDTLCGDCSGGVVRSAVGHFRSARLLLQSQQTHVSECTCYASRCICATVHSWI